jgi:hypothetical protein
MKKTSLFAAAFGIFVVALSFNASAQNRHESETYCSLKTLSGSYTYLTQGYLDGQPYASSGIMSFNGAGQVALIYTRSVERHQLFTSGTYTVNGNCSGSMILGTGTVNDFYVGPMGDSFTWVRATGTGAVGGEAKRVTRGLIAKPQ